MLIGKVCNLLKFNSFTVQHWMLIMVDLFEVFVAVEFMVNKYFLNLILSPLCDELHVFLLKILLENISHSQKKAKNITLILKVTKKCKPSRISIKKIYPSRFFLTFLTHDCIRARVSIFLRHRRVQSKSTKNFTLRRFKIK